MEKITANVRRLTVTAQPSGTTLSETVLVNKKELQPSFTITNSTEISMIYFCSQYVLLLLIESAALLHSDGSTNKTKMLDDPVTAGPVDIGRRAVH